VVIWEVMKRRLFCVIFTFAIIFDSFFLSYAKSLMRLTAKKLILYENPLRVVAIGDVVVRKRGLLIWANKVTYLPNKGLIKLFNYEVFNLKEDTYLAGKNATLDVRRGDFKTNEVYILFKKYGIAVKAWDFEKTPLNEYKAKRALVTTCTLSCRKKSCSPPWDVYFKRFMLSGKGVTSGKASEFRVKKFPIFYLPSIVFLPKINIPLLPHRKAGFLFPQVVQGSLFGWGVETPYFLPVTDQLDFTFAPFYLEKSGIIYDSEARFKLFDNTKGTFKFRYLKDKKHTLGSRLHQWWITGKLDLFGNDWVDAHLDFDLVSSKAFLQNYDIGMGGFTQVNQDYKKQFDRDLTDKSQDFRTSKFWIQFHHDSVYSRLESKYLDYHGSKDPDTISQPLGLYQFSFLSTKIFPFLLTGFNVYAWSNYRKKGYYGQKLSGDFDLSLPFSLGFLMNQISFSETWSFYHLEDATGFSRHDMWNRYYQFSGDTYVLIYRKFGMGLVHSIKPFVSYSYTSRPVRQDVPTFSYDDTLNQTSEEVSYGIWNILGNSTNPQMLRIKVFQSYQLKPKTEHEFSPIYFELEFNLPSKVSLRYNSEYDTYSNAFVRHSFFGNFYDVLFMDRVGLGYEDNPSQNTRQLIISGSKTFFKKWFNSFSLSRNLLTGSLINFSFETGWHYDCYSISVGYSETPQDHAYWFRIELKGLGSYSFR